MTASSWRARRCTPRRSAWTAASWTRTSSGLSSAGRSSRLAWSRPSDQLPALPRAAGWRRSASRRCCLCPARSSDLPSGDACLANLNVVSRGGQGSQPLLLLLLLLLWFWRVSCFVLLMRLLNGVMVFALCVALECTWYVRGMCLRVFCTRPRFARAKTNEPTRRTVRGPRWVGCGLMSHPRKARFVGSQLFLSRNKHRGAILIGRVGYPEGHSGFCHPVCFGTGGLRSREPILRGRAVWGIDEARQTGEEGGETGGGQAAGGRCVCCKYVGGLDAGRACDTW